MLEKLRGHVLISRVSFGQFQCHREHRRAVKGHPGGAVGLLQTSTIWQGFRPVEHADVVQTEEASRKQVLAFKVLAVDPPGKVDQELLEDPGQEESVAFSG